MVTALLAALVTTPLLGLAGVLIWQRRLRDRQRDELARLHERLAGLEQQLRSVEPQLRSLDRNGREQLTLSLVLGNLLVDKGLVEEAEIEDAHRRMVVEPALVREEQDALLEDLPDPEALRARLVRNLPGTLQ